jgi:hypothetical protein
MSALKTIFELVDAPDPYRQAPADLRALHLEAVRELTALRRGQIKLLDRRAAEVGVREVNKLQDVVPLLFSHTTFKTYPDSFVDEGRWSRMNLWLQTLSTRPVDSVDIDGVRDVDGWVARLRDTGHYVFTSSGTSGKPSFMNHTGADLDVSNRAMITSIRNSHPAFRTEKRPVFVPFPRYGTHRMIEQVGNAVKAIGRDGEIHFLSDEPATAGDVMRGARMRRAIASGAATPAEIAEFEALGAQRQQRVAADLKNLLDRLLERRHEPLFINGMWPLIYMLVQSARKRGIPDGDFHADTVITIGGGLKGSKLPEDFREQVQRFFGIPAANYAMTYGMVEMTGTAPYSHAAGGYTLPPWIVPMVLDKAGEKLLNPDDGSGSVEGRFAFIDLLVEGRWGGIITGDKVTIDFSGGRDNVRTAVVREIARYQDLEEGEDKLSCAGTMEDYVRGAVENA